MPAISDPTGLTALITFTLPASRLGHDEAIYLKYDPEVNRPTETIRVPITDLRAELEAETISSPAEQLYKRGFAIAKLRSDLLDSIPSEEGTQKYLDETAEYAYTLSLILTAARVYELIVSRILRKELGATRVIAWNSTVRRNDPEKVKPKVVPMQSGPEKGFVPTTRLQPIAGVAHIDQDDASLPYLDWDLANSLVRFGAKR